MGRDYSKLLQGLQKRMNPEGYSDTQLFSESINKELLNVSGRKALEYVKRAMEGVGNDYTVRSISAGENAITHLESVLTSVTYKFQGSVMTNTHIRGNSDIDLLVICDKFYYSDKEVIQEKFINAYHNQLLTDYQIKRLNNHVNAGSYSGDSYADLKNIRLQSEVKMKEIYCKVDTSKPKCISIVNQNLNRDVDIVVSAWHKTYDGIKDDNALSNRIRVYNKDSNSLGRTESPFVSIDRINNRNSYVNGRLKKMIRFLKVIKNDSDDCSFITLTSFDINAICYNINTSNYSDKIFYQLVPVLVRELSLLINDVSYRDGVMSVDGSEFIFKGKTDKVDSLKIIYNELNEVLSDLNLNLIPSYVN